MPKKTKETLREEVLDGVIARRAYELWEQDGCTHGNDRKHWEEAERQLRGTPAPAPAAESKSDAAPVLGGKPDTAPAPAGNPAYPSKQERDRIVSANTGRNERVAKIPADALRSKS